MFALLSLAVAGVMAAAALGRREDRSACLAHAAMSLGMAGMFAPWGDPVPGPVGAVIFAVIGAWSPPAGCVAASGPPTTPCTWSSGPPR